MRDLSVCAEEGKGGVYYCAECRERNASRLGCARQARGNDDGNRWGGVFHRWFMRRKLERFQQQQQKKVEKQIPSLPTKASWPNHIFTGRKKEKWS
jgi:hypothetical protein